MDIKDVNNANPLLFSKTAAINNAAAALGSGFANLLGQTASAVAGNRETAADVSPKTEKTMSKSSMEDVRAPYRDDKEKRKEVKETVKEKAPKQAKAKKTETAGVVVNGNNEAAPVQNTAKAETVAEVSVAAETVISDSPVAEDVENVAQKTFSENIPSENIEVPSAGAADIAENNVVPQAAATVEDVKAGKYVLNPAAEVESGETPAADVQTEAQPALVEGEEIVVATENEKTTRSHKKENIEAAVVAEEGEKIASLAKRQSAELSEKLDGKQQLKVSVNIEEEKIAYRAVSENFKNRVAVDEAVAAVNNEDAETVGTGNAINTGVVNSQYQAQMPVAGIYAVSAQNVNVSVSENASAAQTAEIVSVSSQGGQTAQVMSGSEFVVAAKAEAAGKENAPSFKEVYKGMSKEAVDQVKVNITKSAVKGIDKIDVQLKPEELGRIEIKMQIGKDGKLQAHIIASRPETMEMLQKEVQSLEKAFNDAGFQTDEGSLSFSFRDDGQSGRNGNDNGELRSFIGNVFEREANNELLAANSDIQGWISDKGLNIRV